MPVELHGDQGIEIGRVAELQHVQLHGVRKRYVPVGQVLGGRAEGGQGGKPNAFVVRGELARQRLGCGHARAGLGQLDGSKAGADRSHRTRRAGEPGGVAGRGGRGLANKRSGLDCRMRDHQRRRRGGCRTKRMLLRVAEGPRGERQSRRQGETDQMMEGGTHGRRSFPVRKGCPHR